MWEYLEPWKWYIASVCMAVLGGVVRGINCPREDFTYWVFAQRVFAAFFTGVMATLILASCDMPETMKTAVACGAGWCGNDILEAIKPWIKKRLGL